MTRPSTTIQSEINALPHDTRLAYVRYHAALNRIDTLSKVLQGNLVYHRGGEDLSNPANNGAAIASLAKSNNGQELAATKAIRDVIASTAQYKDAEERMTPLLEELAIAKEAEEKQQREQARARQEAVEAEAAAREKALAKVDNDPAVKAARKKLAAFDK